MLTEVITVKGAWIPFATTILEVMRVVTHLMVSFLESIKTLVTGQVKCSQFMILSLKIRRKNIIEVYIISLTNITSINLL